MCKYGKQETVLVVVASRHPGKLFLVAFLSGSHCRQCRGRRKRDWPDPVGSSVLHRDKTEQNTRLGGAFARGSP